MSEKDIPVILLSTDNDSDTCKTICEAININSAILFDLINRVGKLENKEDNIDG